MQYRIFLGVILFFLSSLSVAKPIPLELFAKKPQFNSVKLSPDGKHLAATAPSGNQTALVIIDRKNMQVSNVFRFGENEHVDEFYWVNDERLVFTRHLKKPWQEEPISYGQIFAVNLDGTQNATIFGYQASGNSASKLSRQTRHKRKDFAWGDILHILPEDPENIIIGSRTMGNDQDSLMRIIKLNVYNQKKRQIAVAPIGNSKILFNADGAPVAAIGHDTNANYRQYFFKNGEWEEVNESNKLDDYDLVSVNKDESKLYLSSHPNGGIEALYQFDFKTKIIEKLFQHDTTDVLRNIRNPETQMVIGAVTMPGKLEYHYFDPSDDYSKLHSNIVKAFGGGDIRITSRTKNQKELVIYVENDTNPGDFYIFNSEKMSANYLLSRKRWIDPNQMAEKKPIQFVASDGTNIFGYLTMPNQMDSKVPLITLVHGGPFGVRDHWNYDTTSQVLANNGFAVLQINFRGSGGYGLNFKKMAYRKLGTLIQQDIIEGTKWAKQQPGIDSERACIMGWSFGGYSAVMSPLIEPDLFKCSIAAAGYYDAIKQESEADYTEVRSFAAHAAKLYGDDENELKEQSPLTYLDKLQIPVFIVHGGKDERVPSEQAYLLKNAMDRLGKPYEWMFKEKEGHGFYNEKNREEFYQRALTFLDKHLRD